MKLYSDLAEWYPLLTPLEEYEEEGEYFLRLLKEVLGEGRHHLLELGAGAGHNAHYFQEDFDLCLVDFSAQMLALTERSCPDAQRVQGDMRSVRLGRQFDAVFIHDAVCYMRTEDDLRALFETAKLHLRSGGVLIVAPDCVAESFQEDTDCGGSDGEGRSLRYLEWTWQRPGQTDGYVVDYTLVTRVGEAMPVIHHDRQEEGLFPRATWVRLLEEAGFLVEALQWKHSDVDYPLDLFRARCPSS